MTQKTIGVLSPIFIGEESAEKIIQPGKDYFHIKVTDLQMAYHGSIIEQAKQIVLVSSVSFDHPKLGSESVSSLQKVQKLKRNTSLKVGLSQNLTQLLPCVIPSIKVGFEFIIDKANKFDDLYKIVNNDHFTTAIGFATGEMEVAKTLSKLTLGIVNHFIEGDRQKTLLAFNGEFNFFNGSVKEGYYLIIGSQNKKYPLPGNDVKWYVENGQIRAEGIDLSNYSYLLLQIDKVEARTKYLSTETEWYKKLLEAEDLLRNPESFTEDSETELRERWEKCSSKLKEAQVLIRNDANFLPSEAEQIIRSSFHFCEGLLKENKKVRSANEVEGTNFNEFVNQFINSSREELEIATDMDLDEEALKYGRTVRESRQKLKALGWL